MKKKNTVKKNEFNLIFENGKSTKTKFLIIKTLKTNSKNFRIGISAPKKSFKLAIIRNKIKRQIRSIIDLYGFKNGDSLIIVKNSYNYKKDYQNLKKDILNFIKR